MIIVLMKVGISDEVWKLVSPKLSRIVFWARQAGKANYWGLFLNNLTVSLKYFGSSPVLSK